MLDARASFMAEKRRDHSLFSTILFFDWGAPQVQGAVLGEILIVEGNASKNFQFKKVHRLFWSTEYLLWRTK